MLKLIRLIVYLRAYPHGLGFTILTYSQIILKPILAFNFFYRIISSYVKENKIWLYVQVMVIKGIFASKVTHVFNFNQSTHSH